ncbi:MAG: hypothetical protein IIC82_08955 [Chloroflexi bacterium]|nr:hypothetical protein [Chloroflexota bacterium]
MTSISTTVGIKSILTRSGALDVLDRTGLKAPLGRLWQRARHPRLALQEIEVAWDSYQHRRRSAFLIQGAAQADPSKPVLILHLGSGSIGWLKIEATLAKRLQLSGLTPVIATVSRNERVEGYYRAFGIDRFVTLTDGNGREPSPATISAAAERLEAASTRADVEAIEYQGVCVGRHALSTLAMDLRQGRLLLSDDGVIASLRRYLARAMHLADSANMLLDRVQPVLTMVGEKGYFPFAAPYEASVQRGIDTFSWNSSHRSDGLIFKRYRTPTIHTHPFTLCPKRWDAAKAMTWTEARQRELDEEIGRHYGAGIRFQGEPLQAGKRAMSADEIRRALHLDPAKKTVVVFSHVIWDGTVSYGSNLFDDYEEWLVETVKAAIDNPEVNWVIKFHPANLWKSKTTNHTGELWDRQALRRSIGELPAHIKLLDPETEISTFSLFGVTDYAITVRGTIGIEMPCYGIRVFTAGSGRYSGLGFTDDSSTREEYLGKMRHIHAYPALGQNEITLAKKHAHALFLGRPWIFDSFSLQYKTLRQGGHPLSPNMTLNHRTLDAFRAAPDLQAFAAWATESTEDDFTS